MKYGEQYSGEDLVDINDFVEEIINKIQESDLEPHIRSRALLVLGSSIVGGIVPEEVEDQELWWGHFKHVLAMALETRGVSSSFLQGRISISRKDQN